MSKLSPITFISSTFGFYLAIVLMILTTYLAAVDYKSSMALCQADHSFDVCFTNLNR